MFRMIDFWHEYSSYEKMKRFWPKAKSVHAKSITWMPRKLTGS